MNISASNGIMDLSPYTNARLTIDLAAPVVSGAAALVKAINPSLSASDIRDILMFSADGKPN